MTDEFPDMETKKCIDCEQIKKIVLFGKHAGNSDGHSGVCMKCKAKRNANRRVRNTVPADEAYRFNSNYRDMR